VQKTNQPITSKQSPAKNFVVNHTHFPLSKLLSSNKISQADKLASPPHGDSPFHLFLYKLDKVCSFCQLQRLESRQKRKSLENISHNLLVFAPSDTYQICLLCMLYRAFIIIYTFIYYIIYYYATLDNTSRIICSLFIQ